LPAHAAVISHPDRSNSSGCPAIIALDQLYNLESAFYRRFRATATSYVESASIHTSYALQHGYEPLLLAIVAVDPAALARAKDPQIESGDPRDVLVAFNSLRSLVVE
jgi:hypothetical protein